MRRARRAADTQEHLARLQNVVGWVRAEIGQVEISSGDLVQLRERDVVLVEGLTARPDKGEGGTATLRIGRGRLGRMDAEVVVEEGRYGAKITAIHVGDQPPPGKPVEPEDVEAAAAGEGQAGEGNGDGTEAPGPEVEEMTSPGLQKGRDDVEGNAEGAELLNDIPLQISVEIGRVPISAEEIVGLKVGHVFDLQRTAGEPLDLSVNGKIIARGELVEVEGNLGIRIVSMTG